MSIPPSNPNTTSIPDQNDSRLSPVISTPSSNQKKAKKLNWRMFAMLVQDQDEEFDAKVLSQSTTPLSETSKKKFLNPIYEGFLKAKSIHCLTRLDPVVFSEIAFVVAPYKQRLIELDHL